jgi:hypothetical protein
MKRRNWLRSRAAKKYEQIERLEEAHKTFKWWENSGQDDGVSGRNWNMLVSFCPTVREA